MLQQPELRTCILWKDKKVPLRPVFTNQIPRNLPPSTDLLFIVADQVGRWWDRRSSSHLQLDLQRYSPWPRVYPVQYSISTRSFNGFTTYLDLSFLFMFILLSVFRVFVFTSNRGCIVELANSFRFWCPAMRHVFTRNRNRSLHLSSRMERLFCKVSKLFFSWDLVLTWSQPIMYISCYEYVFQKSYGYLDRVDYYRSICPSFNHNIILACK